MNENHHARTAEASTQWLHSRQSNDARHGRRFALALGVATGAFGCGVIPPSDQSPTTSSYCTDLLRHFHLCASGATAAALIFLCITVTAGFLAAQLHNDENRPGFFGKNISTFLFVVAVLSGILGAYFHSSSDAASTAAADIEMAMTNPDSGKRYNLCLAAASRWDGSLAKALDAANAVARSLLRIASERRVAGGAGPSAASPLA